MITARLTDVIREELGESYSPFAAIELTGGATPLGRDIPVRLHWPRPRARRVDRGAGAGGDLRANGVTDVEYAAAISTVGNELELFSNEQLNDEILTS